jgi:hypothetical protein
MVNWKELAKFASGATVWETIVHITLALRGEFPVTFFGISITPTINTMQIIITAIASIALIYYAWIKK